MIKYASSLIALVIFTSCLKKTGCEGTVFSQNGTPASSVDVYIIDSFSNQTETKSKVASTNNDGYYSFSFKSKRNHWYAVTCENDKNGGANIQERKMNTINLYLNK